jgi:hypothetical protein
MTQFMRWEIIVGPDLVYLLRGLGAYRWALFDTIQFLNTFCWSSLIFSEACAQIGKAFFSAFFFLLYLLLVSCIFI